MKRNHNDTTNSDIFEEFSYSAANKEAQFKKQLIRYTILKNLPISAFSLFSVFLLLASLSEIIRHDGKSIDASGVAFLITFVNKQNSSAKMILFLNHVSCFILTLIVLNVHDSKAKINEMQGKKKIKSSNTYKILALSNFFCIFCSMCIITNMFERSSFEGNVNTHALRFDTGEWIFGLVYIISAYVYIFSFCRIFIDNFLELRTAKNSIFICFTIINLLLGAAIAVLYICWFLSSGEVEEISKYKKASSSHYLYFLHSALNLCFITIICLMQSAILLASPYFKNALEEIKSDISDNHQVVANPARLELNAF